MQALEKTLRNKLERTVMEARDVAEVAARAAVEQLGVGEPKPYAHLSADEKELRRKLRIHGRQLGDVFLPSPHGRGAGGEGCFQALDRLVEEIAYEHWHRMLFARFLAENNLLMFQDTSFEAPDTSKGPGNQSPDISPSGDWNLTTGVSFADAVPITLEEAEDLAQEYGLKNGWELSAKVAARMLPQIFRPDSPVFQSVLPPEYEQKLERLLADLPQEVFHASDSLGWVYQFWQAKRKDAVNASEVKIGARELPAVTQLFTEPYMVAFLLDNSLGAWWAARRLTEADLKNAKSEEELRNKASLPGMPLEYLRFVKGEDGRWTPAAGTFDGWPKKLAELKALDPCCGSGHFLVAAFLMLVAMRIKMDGLPAREAADRVLAENIHGLEIDQRCVELAAFALALAAWRYPHAGGYRQLPELNVACTGLSVGGSREQWMEILAGQSIVTNLRFFFGQLYELFSKGPSLGSLINPHRFLGSGLLDERGMQALLQVLRAAVQSESPASERHELGVVAAGLAKAADLLAERYTLVATNVPYLGRGKQDDTLKQHIETQYPLGKADLATAFVLRCLEFCAKGGSTALVTPQNWLFLTTYKNLRETLLLNRTWDMVARLGPGAFETISGHVVNVALPLLSAATPRDDQRMSGIDVSAATRPDDKAAMLRGELPAEIVVLQQKEQLRNPDAKVVLVALSKGRRLHEFVIVSEGLHTGDYPRFGRMFWEPDTLGNDWALQQGGTDDSDGGGGCSNVLYWQEGSGELIKFVQERLGGQSTSMWIKGESVWGQRGVAVGTMSELKHSPYHGALFTHGIVAMVPKEEKGLSALMCYVESPVFRRNVRLLDQKVCVARASFENVPFDLAHWQKVAAEKYPDGLPEPESDDPTQWLFHGRPETSTAPLQVAVARLLGYRWPAENDSQMRLSKRARELVRRCDELLPLADKDGIVCIPPVRGEASAADRLLNLLAAAYGKDWSQNILNRLLKEVGFEGKTLDAWLRDGFFAQHCELFHQRPFVWHIWDGLRDGFSALVNYHKLDRKRLETLIYTYLGDWIKRQKDDIGSGVDGAQERLAAAETLKKRLELILAGEDPYDIFVRWKPIEKQPIGWEPDINDGVRLNIRPFMSVPDIRKKGAGVLREKPKVDWKKDRGKEPLRPIREFPWFWGWNETADFTGGSEFTGERFNDCHYSLDFKRRARREIGAEEKQS